MILLLYQLSIKNKYIHISFLNKINIKSIFLIRILNKFFFFLHIFLFYFF